MVMTYRDPASTKPCLFCNKPIPPSRVAVSKNGKIVGAICGSHSFREVILYRSNKKGERLLVEITLVKDK